MKKLLLLIGLVSLLLNLAACGGPESPVEVIQAITQAITDGDADALDSLACAEKLPLLKADANQIKELGITTKIKANYTLVSETETEATVAMVGIAEMTNKSGDTDFDKIKETFTLIKEDGRWKFCD